MLRAFTIMFVLSFSALAGARASCKVYGISDSPQRLLCTFPQKELLLSCQDGKYFLNNIPVKVAFHLDVESGTVPLVFKSPEMTLTVVMDQPIEAELLEDKAEVPGTCKRI